MRYIEFVYLGLAGMSLIFLATEFDQLSTRTISLMCLSMGIFAFMFAFRRGQRKAMEKRMDEEMDDVWQELADEDTRDEEVRKSGDQ